MRALLILAFLFMMSIPAVAQEGADYAIDETSVRPPRLSADGSVVEFAFDVNNLGSTASAVATVRMVNKDTGEEVASETLRPLVAGEGVTISLSFPVSLLPPASAQTMLISVGIDEVESSSGDIANNMINITIPPLQELEPVPTRTPTPAPGAEGLLQSLGFNPDDPVHMAALAGVGIVLLVILVLLLVVARLMFRRRPRFEVQLPPYANAPLMAPSTSAGRRQGWQVHAQNDLPPAYPANEGATHIRKLLTGIDNTKLTNWEITGLRISQYDQYGRVARSEVIAPRGLCRRLSKTADRASRLSEDQINRRVRPVAQRIVGQFRRRINPRSAMLPIALDIAFQGVHGEVRIRFELFTLEQGRWRMVDTWEPEMTVAGRAIHENFTYTLHGQRQGEPFKLFLKRLQDDLTAALTEMLRHEPSDTGKSQAIQVVTE